MASTSSRTLERSRRGQQPAPETPTPGLVASGGRQRRWSLALVALLLTLGSGLTFVVLWLNAGDRRPVLAVDGNVAAGQVIGREQLQVVRVSSDPGIDPIPASRRDEIAGQVARTDLLEGMLLVDDAIAPQGSGLGAGMAVVAVPVANERLPSPQQLGPGDWVRVYDTGSTSGGEAALGEAVTTARVLSIDWGDSSSSVSLTVEEQHGARIATAVQEDRIYLALVDSDGSDGSGDPGGASGTGDSGESSEDG